MQKACSLKTSYFQPAFPMFIPVLFTCRMLMNFLNEELRSKKGEKNYFFYKLDIKDDNVFYTDIYYDNNNKKIYMLIYIKKVLKNVYAFLIKLLVTAKQPIRRNSICCLKNQTIFTA